MLISACWREERGVELAFLLHTGLSDKQLCSDCFRELLTLLVTIQSIGSRICEACCAKHQRI